MRLTRKADSGQVRGRRARAAGGRHGRAAGGLLLQAGGTGALQASTRGVEGAQGKAGWAA